jgi:hypothetical protein
MAITFRLEKSGRPPLYLNKFAFFFAVCAFVMIIKASIDIPRENKQENGRE